MSTSDPGRAYDGTPSRTPGYYVSSTFDSTGPAWARLRMTWSGTATILGGPTVALPDLTIPAVQQDFTVRSAEGQLVRNG